MARVTRNGEFIGWGATCRKHRNLRDGAGVVCKRQLAFGGKRTELLSDAQCVALLKQWLLHGATISPDSYARDMHLAVDPRAFDKDAAPDALDARLLQLFPDP